MGKILSFRPRKPKRPEPFCVQCDGTGFRVVEENPFTVEVCSCVRDRGAVVG